MRLHSVELHLGRCIFVSSQVRIYIFHLPIFVARNWNVCMSLLDCFPMKVIQKPKEKDDLRDDLRSMCSTHRTPIHRSFRANRQDILDHELRGIVRATPGGPRGPRSAGAWTNETMVDEASCGPHRVTGNTAGWLRAPPWHGAESGTPFCQRLRWF